MRDPDPHVPPVPGRSEPDPEACGNAFQAQAGTDTPLPWSLDLGTEGPSSLVLEVEGRMAASDGPTVEQVVWTALTEATARRSSSDLDELLRQLRKWERYQDLRLLGLGGGGAVFVALDPRLEREVALKFLWTKAYAHQDRAVREAQNQARVDHPHVAKIFESGEILGLAYIAMQRVEGSSLAAALPRLTKVQRLRLIQQAAEGVQAAHGRGVLHLDVKPGNILVDLRTPERPWALVADFGLARTLQGESRGAIGTPPFSSPEQLVFELATVRSDVYGLGMCLDAVLSEQGPFPDPLLDDWPALAAAAPIPLEARVPDLEPDLAAIVRKATAKEAGLRYPSAGALAEDLGRFLAHRPVEAYAGGPLYRLRKGLRAHRVSVGLALGLLGVAALLGRTAWRAQQKSLHQPRMLLKVKEIEDLLRYARSRAPHDLGPELAQVRELLRRLEGEVQALPGPAQPAGWYALGKGHLLLRQMPTARTFLQRAWEEGHRTPEAALALGQVLAYTFRDRTGGLGSGSSEALEKARAQAYAEFGGPALTFMRRGAEALRESPSLVEATLAFYLGGKNTQALDLARKAQQECPWLPDAYYLEGMAWQSMAFDHQLQGEGTDRCLQSARDAFRRGAELVRSDETFLQGELEVLTTQLIRDFEQGEVRPSDLDQGFELCRRAETLLPGSALLAVHRLRFLERWFIHLEDEGRQPGPELDQALDTARRFRVDTTMGLDFQQMVGYLALRKARFGFLRGEDPRPWLREAREVMEPMVTKAGWAEVDLGDVMAVTLRLEGALGRWDEALFAQGRRLFEAAAQREPRDFYPPDLLGDLWLSRARYLRGRNLPAREALEMALRHLEEAIRKNPHATPPKVRRTEVMALLAAEGVKDGRPALEEASRALARRPRARRSLEAQVEALLANERWSEAQVVAEGLVARHSGLWSAHVLLGWAARGAGRHPDALQAFQRATRLKPDSPEAWLGVALCQEALGDARGRQARSRLNQLDPGLRRAPRACPS